MAVRMGDQDGMGPAHLIQQGFIRVAALGQLFQTYLASGPTKYMAEVFQGLTGDADLGAQLALEFYGPIYLLYALYDGAEDKPAVFATLNSHIDRFISRVETIRAANS